MKVLLLVTGAIRNEVDIAPCIKALKDLYSNDHEVTVALATWKPIKKVHMYCNVNYYYDYDISVLKALIPLVDLFLIEESPDINATVKTFKDGGSPLFFYQIGMAIDYFLARNLSFDVVVKTRNDIYVELPSAYVDTALLPLYWPTADHLYSQERFNDHFIISDWRSFIKLKHIYDNIDDLFAKHKFFDNETFWTFCVKSIHSGHIPIIDPVKYIVRGNRVYV